MTAPGPVVGPARCRKCGSKAPQGGPTYRRPGTWARSRLALSEHLVFVCATCGYETRVPCADAPLEETP